VRALLLTATAGVVILAYGLPLALMPLRWARTIGWTVPDDVRLARYFGRSLGTMVLTLALFVVYAALHPELERIASGVTATGLVLVSLPHFVGIVERSQPLFETIEGFVFLALGGMFAWLTLAA
jgi:hypothetical protein